MRGSYQKLLVASRKRELAEFAEKGFTDGEAREPEPVLDRDDPVLATPLGLS